MNNSNRDNTRHNGLKYEAMGQVIKMAAWSVLAGTLFCTMARADDAPEEPAVAATDPGVVAPNEVSQPRVPEQNIVEPTITKPVVTEPVITKPVIVAPSTTNPSASDGAVNKPGAIPEPTVPVVDSVPISGPKTLTASPTTRPAAPSIIAKGLTANGDIALMVNKSTVLSTRVPYKRVSIGQPDIADVNLVGPSEILLTAKKPGSTQLIMWDDQDRSQVIDVNISFDLKGLEAQLQAMFPKAAIKAESANGTIVLRGHVPSLQIAQQATAVASPYGEKSTVLNFLEVSGGQQVVLQVRFAEVSRSVSQGLGFNAFATDGRFRFGLNEGPGGTPPGGLATGGAGTVDPSIPIYGAAQAGNASFELFLSALRSNNLLRVLAEPNLTAISGQQASFLAGGEFPIPVPQAGGGGTAITIEYKQYGIRLNFTPTVLGDGHLRLQCTPEVSDLDYTNSVTLNGFVIPALTTRNVNTTVELAEGQTFALAGLLNNRVTASQKCHAASRRYSSAGHIVPISKVPAQ